MTRFLIVALGAAAVGGIAYGAVTTKAPVIEAEILGRAQAALAEKGLHWARVAVDGRDVSLSGVAPTPEMRAWATAVVAGAPGVRRLADETTLAALSAPELPTVSPYEIAISLEDGVARLTGFAPSETDRAALKARAEETFGVGRVREELALAGGAPDASWPAAAEALIGGLGVLGEGRATLTDREAMIAGAAADANARDKVMETLVAALPPDYVAGSDIAAPEAPPAPMAPVATDPAQPLVLEKVNGVVRLSGGVGSREARARIAARAKAMFGADAVEDRMIAIEPELAPETDRRLAAALTLLGYAPQLTEARAEITAERLSLDGAAEGLAPDAISTALAGALPEGVALTSKLVRAAVDVATLEAAPAETAKPVGQTPESPDAPRPGPTPSADEAPSPTVAETPETVTPETVTPDSGAPEVPPAAAVAIETQTPVTPIEPTVESIVEPVVEPVIEPTAESAAEIVALAAPEPEAVPGAELGASAPANPELAAVEPEEVVAPPAIPPDAAAVAAPPANLARDAGAAPAPAEAAPQPGAVIAEPAAESAAPTPAIETALATPETGEPSPEPAQAAPDQVATQGQVAAPNPPADLPLATPYVLSAISNDGGVRLEGSVPDDSTKSRIAGRAGALFGSVEDFTTLAAGAPNDQWGAAAIAMLEALDALEPGGSAIMVVDDVTVSGRASDFELREKVMIELEERLPSGYRGGLDVDVRALTDQFDLEEPREIVTATAPNETVAALAEPREIEIPIVEPTPAATPAPGSLPPLSSFEDVGRDEPGARRPRLRPYSVVARAAAEAPALPPLPEIAAGDIAACQAALDDMLRVGRFNFEPNSAELLDESRYLIPRTLRIMERCGAAKVEIGGHTDASGEINANIDLSQRRAETILNLLADRGARLSQLAARGYGPARPIASNDTPEGRARNRRIEFTVLQ